MAQGLLLKYLDQTANRRRRELEDRLLENHKQFKDFRTKAAKEIRNNRLKNEQVNYMHCAFRYRGKANYRDSLYLTYGTRLRTDYVEFLHNLAVTARFAFICSFAHAERAYGTQTNTNFLKDLECNFRGQKSGTDT